ncbi:MAG: Uma2 family endonuclease [Tepidisphaeraceae bacterium]|jgi:Uma2 family endonuclease
MSTASTIKMTARQFLLLGEDPPGVRLELADGEIAVSPSPIPEHSYVVGALHLMLAQHIKSHRLGELYMDVDTIVGVHIVRRPDILFFSTERLHFIGAKAMEGPPDLCVEVISPSSEQVDRDDKFSEYEDFEVPNYWIVDPAVRTFEAFQRRRKKYTPVVRGQGGDIVHAPPFPELAIPLGELWRPSSRRRQ